jgi:hypothetical protein
MRLRATLWMVRIQSAVLQAYLDFLVDCMCRKEGCASERGPVYLWIRKSPPNVPQIGAIVSPASAATPVCTQ